MKNFLLVYRADYNNMPTGTPEQMEAMTKKWMDWIMSIAADNKLVDRGNRLHNTGRVVKGNNVVTNGPFVEIKESIGGYSMVKAASYDEAVAIAHGCPIYAQGGHVEVREVNEL